MTPRLALVAGGVAVAAGALYSFVRRRPRLGPTPGPELDPRADALRRKLAESRDVVGERAEFEAAETPIDLVEPLEDVDERRREVHTRAQATVDEMRHGGDE